MTDDEVLRLGCEVAGTVHMSRQDEARGGSRWWAVFFEPDGQRVVGYEKDRMLTAYVAELLVARIAGDDPPRSLKQALNWQQYEQHHQRIFPGSLLIIAPAMQRIRAALVALGHEAAGEVS